MRTINSVVVEDNPTFLRVESTRVECPHCSRWVGSYQRRGETMRRVFWHRANQGQGSFADPIQFRKCPGSGQEAK